MPFRLSPYIDLFRRGLYDSVRYSFNVLRIDEDFSKDTPTTSTSRNSSQQHPHQPRTRTNAATNENKSVISSLRLLCFFNGVILLSGMLCFNYIFLPLIRRLFSALAGVDSSSSSHSLAIVQHILTYTFNFFWLIPAYIISKFVNSYWFEDIAGKVFKKLTKSSKSARPLSPARAISDIIFSIVMQLFFLVQATIIMLIPIPKINTIIGYMCLCLLYSFYSFEYAWLYRNFEFRHRVKYIENYWPYFLGFGLPLTILSNAFSNYMIVNGCIFSILFPFAIVAATSVKFSERITLPDGPAKIASWNIFTYCIRLTSWLFQLINVRRAVPEELPAQ